MDRTTLIILTFIQHGKQKVLTFFNFFKFLLKITKKGNRSNRSSTAAYRQRLRTHVEHPETRKIQYRVQHRSFTILQIVDSVVFLPILSFFSLDLSLCYLNTYKMPDTYHPKKSSTTNYEL